MNSQQQRLETRLSLIGINHNDLPELAPCHCQNPANKVYQQLRLYGMKWIIACDCGSTTKPHDTLEDAAYCWNWMHDEQPKPAVDEMEIDAEITITGDVAPCRQTQPTGTSGQRSIHADMRQADRAAAD